MCRQITPGGYPSTVFLRPAEDFAIFSGGGIGSSLGRVAMNASSPARSSSEMVSSNSCSSRFFLIACSQQESLAQRYAPRPDFLPVASTKTCPSGVRTTRNNSRFGFVSWQDTQLRSGTCFGRLVCFVADLAILLILLNHHMTCYRVDGGNACTHRRRARFSHHVHPARRV